MKIKILGSGGAMPTPRPFCQCELCKKARKIGKPYKRNSSSILIEEINTVIDCGEDIADSLNRENVKQVDNLFITHWHPDHTFGFRTIVEANYNFRTAKPERQINVYIPKKVYETLKLKLGVVDYLTQVQKTGKLVLIEDGDEIKIKDTIIKVAGYKGKESDTYAYLIKEGKKNVLYAPCDTIDFDNYKNFIGLDLLINECGIFSKHNSEIMWPDLIKRIEEIKPKKIIMTHIEEVELQIFGEKYLDKLKKENSKLNLDFARDGMQINI